MITFKKVSKKFKVYSENEVVGYNYSIIVKDSYYNINKGKNYVIVNFDVSKYGREDKLNVNNLILMIDKDEYTPNKNICYDFDYLGKCYKKQYITQDVSSYIIVYEVDSLNIEKSYLVYRESYEDSYKVKLDLENYD